MGWDQFTKGTVSVAALSTVTPAQWCRTFFLLAAGGVGLVAAAPRETRTLLMDYGARKSDDKHEQQQHHVGEPSPQGEKKLARLRRRGGGGSGTLVSLVASVTSRGQVPHAWFVAFYVMSLGCSLFWLAQFLADGALLRRIASRQAADVSVSFAAFEQVAAGWVMMFLQATRRIFEHATIIKPSKSTMWFVHWLLGLCFYLCIGISTWVEGSRAILETSSGSIDHMAPGLKILVATPVFLFAWINQYRSHKHLAGLKKYSFPNEGLFRHLICPHYTCECFVYLSLAVATAPTGECIGNSSMVYRKVWS
ncbi:hypothetical protein B0H63DRAFT_526431 [Podospora didyma]|uniref:Polyprenal reductase n=1 Tax=Podospora didyma TaxID=330526 RepID=A0AAE0KG09_9PEZI|nr:hypothetical protein B0H63DRAFT_526431 [Podospora didyma]